MELIDKFVFSEQDLFCFFQIRAANLSGDCAFKNEVTRFNFGFKQHQQVPAEKTSIQPQFPSVKT